MPGALQPRCLSRPEAAAYLGVGEAILGQLGRDGTLPPPLRFGRRLLWDRRALDLALDRLSGIRGTRPREAPAPAEDAMLRAIHGVY